MKYNVSSKGLNLSDKEVGLLEKYADKLAQFLGRRFEKERDLDFLDITIRKHKKRRLNHIKDLDFEEEKVYISGKPAVFETAAPKSQSPVYYNGTIKFVIPKKPIIAHFRGENFDKAVTEAFTWLFKELETFKGKHFESHSKYYDRRTIRKGGQL